MEIVLKSLSYMKYLKDINITLNNGNIYGIYGKNSNILGEIINNDIEDYKGEISKDNNTNISYIVSSDDIFYTNTVKDEFEFICGIKGENNNIKQNVIELFYLLDIDEELYYRKIYDLSRSEKYLIKIVLGLITNPNVIIFNNIFNGLDLKYRKKLIALIEKLSKDSIVILIDDDSNILYSFTNYIYIIKDGGIAVNGKTENIYKDVEKLIKLKIEVPYLCDIVYKAKKKKGIKLNFRKDVRDTMKDIYRNV